MQTQPCSTNRLIPKREKLDFVPKPPRTYSLAEILMDICQAFNEPMAGVLGKNRKRERVLCRKLFCFVAKEKTGAKLKAISDFIGGRHHATAIHHIDDIKGFFAVQDPDFRLQWQHYLEKSALFTASDFKQGVQ